MKIKTNSKNNTTFAQPTPQVVHSDSGLANNVYVDITSYLNKKETFSITSNNHYIKITDDNGVIHTFNRGTYIQPILTICGNRIDYTQAYSSGYNNYTENINWSKVEIMRTTTTLFYSILKY